jgi:hypothetical protein
MPAKRARSGMLLDQLKRAERAARRGRRRLRSRSTCSEAHRWASVTIECSLILLLLLSLWMHLPEQTVEAWPSPDAAAPLGACCLGQTEPQPIPAACIMTSARACAARGPSATFVGPHTLCANANYLCRAGVHIDAAWADEDDEDLGAFDSVACGICADDDDDDDYNYSSPLAPHDACYVHGGTCNTVDITGMSVCGIPPQPVACGSDADCIAIYKQDWVTCGYPEGVCRRTCDYDHDCAAQGRCNATTRTCAGVPPGLAHTPWVSCRSHADCDTCYHLSAGGGINAGACDGDRTFACTISHECSRCACRTRADAPARECLG